MQPIRVERSDGLVTITLDRPEKKNAITYTSEDVREGIAAFLERRQPRFRGC